MPLYCRLWLPGLLEPVYGTGGALQFGSLKSRGFCLEATHVVAPERLSKLFGLLALAFCWAFAAGVWLAQNKSLRLKKHGRAAVSLFRRGLDWLRRVLMPLCGHCRKEDFNTALVLQPQLTRTYNPTAGMPLSFA
jgi:hypothetical protein